MVEISRVAYLLILLPSIISLSIFAVAWWVSFRISRQKQSGGFFLISLGFLVKVIVDASWNAFYWLVLGGPFQVVELVQRGFTAEQIGSLSALESLIGFATEIGSTIAMVALILKGALSLIRETPMLTTPASQQFDTSPVFVGKRPASRSVFLILTSPDDYVRCSTRRLRPSALRLFQRQESGS